MSDVTMQAFVRTIPPQAANSGVQEHMTERVDVGWSVRGVPLGRIPRRAIAQQVVDGTVTVELAARGAKPARRADLLVGVAHITMQPPRREADDPGSGWSDC